MISRISISTNGQGLVEITQKVANAIKQSLQSDGICTIFVRHTSASLIIQENADPSARRDMEVWLSLLVAEDNPCYTHIHEGSDDMPAHIKSMLTQTSCVIPYENSKLLLGNWQGIYLWEHRHGRHSREIIVHT